jgi:mRNA-degrading endonuclease RelE of RelBE toxin-antitoxin system
MSSYAVGWTEPAIRLLEGIRDVRVRSRLLRVAEALREAPHQRGRPLRDEFSGYWSLHWSRYRIIYIIEDGSHVVRIAAVGMRAEGKPHDVYETARRLLSQGLLDPPAN